MRVHLKGEGTPIPTVALPDPGSDVELPSLTLDLPDGSEFIPEEYLLMGYTHFEVWCVGGAGGRGGNVTIFGGYGGWSYGGGGGGGGLHRVAGLLEDLSESCAVVVGQAGENGVDSNEEFERKYISTGHPVDGPWILNPDYIAAEAGEDGGASSFDGTTCRASGGKGGFPTERYNYSGGGPKDYPENAPGGNGGQGGKGGQTAVGGGGNGAESELHFVGDPDDVLNYTHATLTPAIDGTWNGTIGQGGGGGRGGNWYHPGPPIVTDPDIEESSSGGRGSFSFSDTSVYGERGNRTKPFIPGSDASDSYLIPGVGGGAKLDSLAGFGSYAPSFDPNGVVRIRLVRIV